MLGWPSLSVEVTFSMKSSSSLLSSMLPRSKVERSARIGYFKRVTNKERCCRGLIWGGLLGLDFGVRGCLAMQGMGFKECEDWSSLVSAAFPPPTAEASWLRYGSARKLSTFLGFEVTCVCGIKVEAVRGPRGWAHRSLVCPTRPSLISRGHHHGGT